MIDLKILKSGWKSSEFWLMVVLTISVVAIQSGLLTGFPEKIQNLGLIYAGAVSYVLQRGYVKASVQKSQNGSILIGNVLSHLAQGPLKMTDPTDPIIQTVETQAANLLAAVVQKHVAAANLPHAAKIANYTAVVLTGLAVVATGVSAALATAAAAAPTLPPA